MSALPQYLKSLETLLGTPSPPETASSSAPVVATATATATPTPTATEEPLSSIGFGTMFSKPASDKLRFMLVSTHAHQFTGYSKVSHGILTELAKEPWLDLTHYAIQKFHDLPASFRSYPAGVDVVDATSLEKPLQSGFGFNALPEVIRKKKPNVLMIYNDMAVVAQFVEAIRKSGIPRDFKIWVYCDQVYTTQSQAFLDILNRDADRVFAFTPFWK